MPRSSRRWRDAPASSARAAGLRGKPYAAAALAAALALAACGPGAAPPPERLVLVSIDTLRADHVGAYGAERAHTPTLDRLAAEGTLFEAAIAPTPLTLPSHASLLTGREPPRHGVRHNSVYRLGEDVPTLAEGLGEAGYATAGFVGALVLDARFGLARGFDRYDDAMGGRASAGTTGYVERRADRVVDAALAWLEEAPPRFFLWVHLYDPHAAYDPPPGFAAAFASAPYDGEIAFADAQVGRLLEALRERFGREGTLVVATSDHGESLGEHGEASHSYGVYEATQRVPLLLRGPDVPAGRRVEASEAVAALVDVAPTLLERAGAAALPGADGRSLLPLLRGGSVVERAVYVETVATRLDFGWSPLLGLRSARWKYIRAPRPELYDLRADPDETRNLASERPERARTLERALSERLDRERAEARRAGLSEADRERLESLGYVVPEGELAEASELEAPTGPDPKDRRPVLAALSRAERMMARGRAEAARGLLAELPEPGPAVLATRAAAALAAGRPEHAEADARAGLAREPRRSDLRVLLGQALERQGRLEEARAAYEAARAIDPRSGPALVGLGRLAERRGEAEAAAALYRSAREAGARGTEPVWRLAALDLEAGREERARALLGELSAEERRAPEAALRLAAALAERGERERAIERLRRAARGASAPTPSIAAALAGLLEEAGRPREAIAAYERGLEASPDDPRLQNGLAWELLRRGDEPERALRLAERATEAAPGVAAFEDTRAEAELRAGRPAAALATAERALERDAPGLRAHLHYVRAAALAALGREAEARAALRASRDAEGADGAEEGFWRSERRALAARLDGDRAAR